MRTNIIILLIFIIVAMAGFGYFLSGQNKNNKQGTTENALNSLSQNNLLPQTNSQGEILFTVTPLDFSFEEPMKFEIAIDAHSGSLNFDLTEISFLEDDEGNKYQAMNWQGPGPGGHHLTGILSFPKINNQAKMITLNIKDAYLRVFDWNLE